MVQLTILESRLQRYLPSMAMLFCWSIAILASSRAFNRSLFKSFHTLASGRKKLQAIVEITRWKRVVVIGSSWLSFALLA